MADLKTGLAWFFGIIALYLVVGTTTGGQSTGQVVEALSQGLSSETEALQGRSTP